MRTSSKKTTAAALRSIIKITDDDWASRLGCSRATIHSVESGRLKLSESLAMKMFHETQISPQWLLDGNPKSSPVSAKGEPYTAEIFDRAQAQKRHFDQQHPYFRMNDALGFCAQLVAILDSANKQKNYFMAAYQTGKALDELRAKFGQNFKIYSSEGAHVVRMDEASRILNRLAAHAKQHIAWSRASLSKLSRQKKPRSSHRQRRA